MGLFSLFWDMRQDQGIREAQDAAAKSARHVQSTQQELDELRAAVDRLSLMNQALWELLRDRAELSDADLRAKADEVDRRDGRADGRMGEAVAACPKCAKANVESRARCLYCGATLRGTDAR
jgi:hypothetical protein